MTVLPILRLPKDVLGVIASRAGEDVLALRKTCKQLREASTTAFEAYQRQLIVERYGTHLESEKAIPFDVLDRRGKMALSLAGQMGLSLDDFRKDRSGKALRSNIPDLWLEIDQDSFPKMINYNAHFFEGKSSIELWKAKYQFYRREPYRNLGDRLRNLFEEQLQIAEKLFEQPLNPAHPLQDLRDRSRRSEILRMQSTILWGAWSDSRSCYDSFINSLSRLERAIFYVASLFHSLFKKSYNKTVAFPAALNSLVKWITEGHDKLGEATISLGDELTKVEIKANFSLQGSQLNPKTDFSIVRTSDKRTLGCFAIERAWTRITQSDVGDPFYTENMNNVGKNIRVLKDRRLFINQLSDNTDNNNGEITNLLTRLALEIFQHESEQKLVIEVSNLIFEKTIDNGKTTIIAKDLYTRKPVDNPWQGQIQQNPLLSRTKGPILPKFFRTNLFRFEEVR